MTGLWKEGGLTFLGMAAIMDPPRLDINIFENNEFPKFRPESAQAIKQCKEAGIKVGVIFDLWSLYYFKLFAQFFDVHWRINI